MTGGHSFLGIFDQGVIKMGSHLFLRHRFLMEKLRRWDSNYACVIEWPFRAASGSGRLRGLLWTFSSLQASKVSTRELRLLNFLWSMVLLERETSAQNGRAANMGVMRSDHCSQLGSIASLAPETTGGEILVAFWSKHGLRSDLRVPNFPGGACT